MPRRYELTIQPMFKSNEKPSWYNGTMVVEFECVGEAPVSYLVMHAKDIDIYNSSLRLASSTDSSFGELTAFPFEMYRDGDFFVINLNDTVAAAEPTPVFRPNNTYTFRVSFVGYTRDDNIGFYRTFYHDPKDNSKK